MPSLRQLDFPYPYAAMVAIESDIDATAIGTFRETMRFIRTEADTLMGPGLGLDFENSFWVYGPPVNGEVEDRMVYIETPEDASNRPWYADELVAYVNGGWATTLHCYGRVVGEFQRAHAERALERLAAIGAKPSIWTNHGRNNMQNMRGLNQDNPRIRGDDPATKSYHADLLRDFGVRHFWIGASSTVTGGTDAPTAPGELLDGRKAWIFDRYVGVVHDVAAIDHIRRNGMLPRMRNPRNASTVWQPAYLDTMLSEQALDALVAKRQYCIVAQHLGNIGGMLTFSRSAVAALRRLRARQYLGEILVASTARLLDYYVAQRHLIYELSWNGDVAVVDLKGVDDPVTGKRPLRPQEADGLSFALATGGGARPARIDIAVDGKPLPADRVFVEDVDGELVFGVAWTPPDKTDLTAEFGPPPPKPARATAPVLRALASFNRRPDGAMLAVGERAVEWHAALVASGYRCADPAARRPPLAIATAAPTKRPTEDILQEADDVAWLTTPRIVWLTTNWRKLKAAADDDDTAMPAELLERLWTDEIRRMRATAGRDKPRLIRDLADFERRLLWARYQKYAPIGWTTDEPADEIGANELFVVCRPTGLDYLRLLLRGFSDASEASVFREVDRHAETYGGPVTLNEFAKSPPAFQKSNGAEYRQRLFNPKTSASDVQSCMRETTTSDARTALLAAKVLIGRGEPAAALAALTRIANDDALILSGYAAAETGDVMAAHAHFETAFARRPNRQAALIGYLATAARSGRDVDWRGAIARSVAEAEEVAELDRRDIAEAAFDSAETPRIQRVLSVLARAPRRLLAR